MVEPSPAAHGNVTDIVVAAQARLALVRVQEHKSSTSCAARRLAPRAAARRRPPEPLPADARSVNGGELGSTRRPIPGRRNSRATQCRGPRCVRSRPASGRTVLDDGGITSQVGIRLQGAKASGQPMNRVQCKPRRTSSAGRRHRDRRACHPGRGAFASRQITMRSISSSVTVSAVRSYSFVVLGDAWPAICWACSSVPPFDRYAVMPVARNV